MRHRHKLNALSTLLIDSENPEIITYRNNNDFLESLFKGKIKDPLPDCAIAMVQTLDIYEVQRVIWIRITEINNYLNGGGENQHSVKYDFIDAFYPGDYEVEFGLDSKTNVEVVKYVTLKNGCFN